MHFKKKNLELQLNRYETAPNFIQISQNCRSKQNKYDQVMQELRKNREIQINQQTIQCQVLAVYFPF